MSETQSVVKESSRIFLTCPQAVQEADVLCFALEQALIEIAPEREIRKGNTELAGNDLAVTLIIKRETDRLLEGHLEWSTSNAAPTSGPPVTLSVEDAKLSSQMYDSFAAGLVKVSNLPLND